MTKAEVISDINDSIFQNTQKRVTATSLKRILKEMLDVPVSLANDKMFRGSGGIGVASTASFADTYGANQLLYSNGANNVQGLSTANNGILATGATGIPAIATVLPIQVQDNITQLGTIISGTWNGATIPIAYGGTGATTANDALNALLPSQGGNGGKFLKTDGTDTSWDVISATPGGADTNVQFNNAGSFGGSANFLWNNGANELRVNGKVGLDTSTFTSSIPAFSLFTGKFKIQGTTSNSWYTETAILGDNNSLWITETGAVGTVFGSMDVHPAGVFGTFTNHDVYLFSNSQQRIKILADGRVGINGTPNASAILDVNSTAHGVLFPRVTSAEKNAIATPATSLLVFDTTLNTYNFYDGASWTGLGGGTTISGLTQDYIPKSNPAGDNIVNGTWAYSGNTIYPITDGSNIGISVTNRIGTIYMASTIDYAATMLFKEAGTERMRISAGGNVGINTTPAASTKFHVVGGSGDSPLRVDTNTLSNALLVNSSGNVGIGVAPSALLHLEKTTNPTFRIGVIAGQQYGIINSTDNSDFELKDITADYIFYQRTNSDAHIFRFTNNDSNIRWSVRRDSTNLLSLDGTGLFGINQVTPIVRLDVADSGVGTKTIFQINNTATATIDNSARMIFAANRTTSGRTTTAAIDGIITDIDNINHKGALAFSTQTNGTMTEKLRLDYLGNVGINTSTFGTSAAGVLGIKNGTAPTTQPADMIQLYAKDVASSSELFVLDEAGNETQLSPHYFGLIPGGASEELAWSYYSKKNNKEINVDLLAVIRAVENITGGKFVHTKES